MPNLLKKLICQAEGLTNSLKNYAIMPSLKGISSKKRNLREFSSDNRGKKNQMKKFRG